MSDEFIKMQERALAIKARYHELEKKKWGVEQTYQGLVTDVGELGEMIMAYEGYRDCKSKDINKALEHELSDVLYAVIVLADKLNIDLEKGFYKTMDELDNRLR